MRKKTVVALLIVLGGMGWVYVFFASGTKTTDLMSLSMGLVMVFQGLKELLEDQNAAAAQVRNACFVLILVGMSWELLH
jgi:hypothetical protein